MELPERESPTRLPSTAAAHHHCPGPELGVVWSEFLAGWLGSVNQSRTQATPGRDFSDYNKLEKILEGFAKLQIFKNVYELRDFMVSCRAEGQVP